MSEFGLNLKIAQGWFGLKTLLIWLTVCCHLCEFECLKITIVTHHGSAQIDFVAACETIDLSDSIGITLIQWVMSLLHHCGQSCENTQYEASLEKSCSLSMKKNLWLSNQHWNMFKKETNPVQHTLCCDKPFFTVGMQTIVFHTINIQIIILINQLIILFVNLKKTAKNAHYMTKGASLKCFVLLTNSPKTQLNFKVLNLLWCKT